MDWDDKQQLYGLITQVLASSASDIGILKPVLSQLGGLLSRFSDIDVDTVENIAEGETKLVQGLAVSPVIAAKCLQDIARSRAFILGVNQAIQDKLTCSDKLIRDDKLTILYAGTGPYGLLLLPLVFYYLQAQSQKQPQGLPSDQIIPNIGITLLDIHETSIAAVTKVVIALGLEQVIDEILLADATQWQPKTPNQFDIIVSETMNYALRQEPQMFIFAHLQQFLKPDGVLIPEQVRLSAWLTDLGQETRKMLGETSRHRTQKIADFYQLDRRSAQDLLDRGLTSLHHIAKLPSNCGDFPDLKICTDIQVYGDYRLTECESSLTLNKNFPDCRLQANQPIEFNYKMQPEPQFEWTSELSITSGGGIELAAHQAMGRLDIVGVKRLWSKSQQQRLGALPNELQQVEWSRDLAIIDSLGVSLKEWMAQVFYCKTFTEFEDWLEVRVNATAD
ncbi:hypothetical protein PE36_08876 [Moritella sp. PE36]|uniref:class I SAM-dependent methyltransferase n=1 Tax=Moritella sp. PE36 TaxID=58051 RepID=UPI0001568558|nr:class I SAM-dependent methyltransferase [Moritella sp. PE36]EDM67132.1 hypothetical protein PE36_08876 [Moritella sp. PE36]